MGVFSEMLKFSKIIKIPQYYFSEILKPPEQYTGEVKFIRRGIVGLQVDFT